MNTPCRKRWKTLIVRMDGNNRNKIPGPTNRPVHIAKMGSGVLALLSVSLLVLCFSCKQPDEDPVPRDTAAENKNVLRFDVYGPFNSLDPRTDNQSGSTIIFPLLYSYLFIPDEHGVLKPDLASEWFHTSDFSLWTITLRQDARFHDGKPVTPGDVKYSLETVLKKQRPSLYEEIDRIEILSTDKLLISLRKHNPHFDWEIWYVEIIPDNAASNMDIFPIGSGPFKFDNRVEDRQVCLEANAQYYNGGPSLAGIDFFFEPRKEKSWSRLIGGKTDINLEIPLENYEKMKFLEHKFFFDVYTLPYYRVLLYNINAPLFSDPNVRMALSLAVDKHYIVKNMLKGFGKVANGPIGVGSKYHNPNVKPIPYNPDYALKLLRKAGWSMDFENNILTKDGIFFEFSVLVFRENPFDREIARFLEASFNEIGIYPRFEYLSFKNIKSKYYSNTEFQAVLTEVRGIYHNPNLFKLLWSPDPPLKAFTGSFYNSEIARLINEALSAGDISQQRVLFFKIDELMSSLQPGTFLYHRTAINAMSKRFETSFPFSLRLGGLHRLRHISLKDS